LESHFSRCCSILEGGVSMKRSFLLCTALLLALAGFVATDTPSGAQQMIDFTIGKFSCPTDPGNVSLAAGNIPDTCDPSSGVSFTVTMTDGTVIGSCTTDASGICKVQVPNEATVTATEDVSTAPAGFTPRENPITTQAVTEFAGALFINLPTTQPPTVGVGTAAVKSNHEVETLLFYGLIALALAGAGFFLRRRLG
jgi:hypothetical protein